MSWLHIVSWRGLAVHGLRVECGLTVYQLYVECESHRLYVDCASTDVDCASTLG